MPRLVAPGPEDVGHVVAVVVPIDAPVGRVVLPDHDAFGLCRQFLIHGRCHLHGAVDVARFTGRCIGGKTGFHGVHVSVLPAIRRQRPVGARLIGVESEIGLPETVLHQFEGLFQPVLRLGNPRLQRVRVGQQHKGEAVAMIGRVEYARLAVFPMQQPGVTAGDRVAMHVTQKVDRPARIIQIGRCVRKMPCRHRPQKDVARTAHQMACVCIEYRAIVLEKMVQPAARIDRAGMVERKNIAHVVQQVLTTVNIR